jgi:hypothetical protein
MPVNKLKSKIGKITLFIKIRSKPTPRAVVVLRYKFVQQIMRLATKVSICQTGDEAHLAHEFPNDRQTPNGQAMIDPHASQSGNERTNGKSKSTSMKVTKQKSKKMRERMPKERERGNFNFP